MLKCLLKPFLRKSPPIPLTSSRAFSTSKCLCLNYYDVLKLNPNASQKEIKEAYFKLSKQNHPDLNQNDPSCHDRFIKLQEAYKVLSNPISRKEYDMGSGEGKRESYYHRDARKQPDFSARDEWIRQQNERMQREMRFGEQFEYNDQRRYNMTPEEMRRFLQRKRIATAGDHVFSINFFFIGFLMIIIMISLSESTYARSVRRKYEEDMWRYPHPFKEVNDPVYYDRSWETRSKLMNKLREAELKDETHSEK